MNTKTTRRNSFLEVEPGEKVLIDNKVKTVKKVEKDNISFTFGFKVWFEEDENATLISWQEDALVVNE